MIWYRLIFAVLLTLGLGGRRGNKVTKPNVGPGATFHFILPVLGAPPACPAAPRPTRRDDIPAPVTPCRHRLPGPSESPPSAQPVACRAVRVAAHRGGRATDWGPGLARNMHYVRLASALHPMCKGYEQRRRICRCDFGLRATQTSSLVQNKITDLFNRGKIVLTLEAPA